MQQDKGKRGLLNEKNVTLSDKNVTFPEKAIVVSGLNTSEYVIWESGMIFVI